MFKTYEEWFAANPNASAQAQAAAKAIDWTNGSNGPDVAVLEKNKPQTGNSRRVRTNAGLQAGQQHVSPTADDKAAMVLPKVTAFRGVVSKLSDPIPNPRDNARAFRMVTFTRLSDDKKFIVPVDSALYDTSRNEYVVDKIVDVAIEHHIGGETQFYSRPEDRIGTHEFDGDSVQTIVGTSSTEVTKLQGKADAELRVYEQGLKQGQLMEMLEKIQDPAKLNAFAQIMTNQKLI